MKVMRVDMVQTVAVAHHAPIETVVVEVEPVESVAMHRVLGLPLLVMVAAAERVQLTISERALM